MDDYDHPDEILSWPQVRPLAGDIGRTTAWRWIRAGLFPAPVRLGAGGRVGWKKRDILNWQASLGCGDA